MEANIKSFKFKLNESSSLIEVYDDQKAEEPYTFIRVADNINEKDFHFEISDWYIKNVSNYGSDTQVNWLFSLDAEEIEKTTTLTLSAEHQQTEIEHLQEVVVSLQQQVNSLTERVTVLEESS